MAISEFPQDAVCYILVDVPGVGEFQATGAIIGPHTILTAAHVLWDADAGTLVDKVSVYPGFTPDSPTYNPTGALPGLQSIHAVHVPDNGGRLTAGAVQSDFAVIDTSTDLSGYGSFALDPGFTSGNLVMTGYPAAKKGLQTASEGVVSASAALSDIDYAALLPSAGDSGGPLWHETGVGAAERPAIAGIVSTSDDAMKLTAGKVALIRRWIAADRSLWRDGSAPAAGLTPQIAGTVSGSAVDSAPVGATTLAAALAAPSGTSPAGAVVSGTDAASATAASPFAALVDILHRTSSSDADLLATAPAATPTPTLTAPASLIRPGLDA